MRSTKPGITSSLYGLLMGRPPVHSEAWRVDRTEDIRQAMQESLGQAGAVRFPVIARRIDGAQDATGLWYLRSILMEALCDVHGEQAARHSMATLSDMFDGVLPEALASRPSPLGGKASRR